MNQSLLVFVDDSVSVVVIRLLGALLWENETPREQEIPGMFLSSRR